MEGKGPIAVVGYLTGLHLHQAENPLSMDAYEVHKKIQEAIMAIEVYKVKSAAPTSMWHKEIINGLDELGKQRQALAASNVGQIKISKI